MIKEVVVIKDLIERGKISGYQLGLLLIPTIVATGILFIPAVTARDAGNAGWISVLIIATIPGLIVAELCIQLERRYPGKTLVQYSTIVLGEYFGKAIGGFYLFFLYYVCAVIINEFTSFIVVAFLNSTPPLVVTIAFMLVAASMVRNGLEVICRMNELTVIFFLLFFLILVSLVLSDANISNLFPVFDKGVIGAFKGALPPIGWRGEVVIIAMLLPALNKIEQARRVTYSSVIAVGVILAIDTIITITVLGDISPYLTFPVLAVAEYVSLAEFLERIEAIIVVIWVSGVLIKVAIFYYVAVLGTAQWIRLKEYKALVFPIGMILTIWSQIIFGSSPELVKFLTTTFVPWALFNEIAIPIILMTVTVFTGWRAGKP